MPPSFDRSFVYLFVASVTRLGYFLGMFWTKLGYFLSQRLVTLFAATIAVTVVNVGYRTTTLRRRLRRHKIQISNK